MAAGNDGGGVLLDMDGKMIGIILDHEEEYKARDPCCIGGTAWNSFGKAFQRSNPSAMQD